VVEETLAHLFIGCPFSQACWATIHIAFTEDEPEDEPFLALEEVKGQLAVPFFMEIIITFCWSIWMQRNDCIFKDLQPHPDSCLRHFKSEFALVILRAKARFKSPMSKWLDNLV
jgi:hypothetical protein